jgi:hypothetical protein
MRRDGHTRAPIVVREHPEKRIGRRAGLANGDATHTGGSAVLRPGLKHDEARREQAKRPGACAKSAKLRRHRADARILKRSSSR